MLTVIVRRRLERRFRCSLPTTLLWRRPTVAAVSAYIAGLVSVSGGNGHADVIGAAPVVADRRAGQATTEVEEGAP